MSAVLRCVICTQMKYCDAKSVGKVERCPRPQIFCMSDSNWGKMILLTAKKCWSAFCVHSFLMTAVRRDTALNLQYFSPGVTSVRKCVRQTCSVQIIADTWTRGYYRGTAPSLPIISVGAPWWGYHLYPPGQKYCQLVAVRRCRGGDCSATAGSRCPPQHCPHTRVASTGLREIP